MSGAVVKIIPIADMDTFFAKSHSVITPIIYGGAMNVGTPSLGQTWHTYYGDKRLGKNDIKGLNNGERAICVAGLGLWFDDTGKYETDVGACFALDSSPPLNFNWHLLPEHNRETKRS